MFKVNKGRFCSGIHLDWLPSLQCKNWVLKLAQSFRTQTSFQLATFFIFCCFSFLFLHFNLNICKICSCLSYCNHRSVYTLCTEAYLLLNSKARNLFIFFFFKIIFLNLNPDTVTRISNKEAVQFPFNVPPVFSFPFLMAQVVPRFKSIIKVRKWRRRSCWWRGEDDDLALGGETHDNAGVLGLFNALGQIQIGF